jgi:hypothetical protein
MLCRVSCKACHISCLWTDDPKAFIESVCMRYRHCEAKLVSEEFQQPARGVRAKSVPREVRKPVFPAGPAAR